MARYTINLSRAKKYSRRKRAKKAMAVLKEELEKREGEAVSISPEVNVKIWENGIENPPSKIELEVQDAATGKVAVLPGTEPEPEPEPEPEEEEESGEEPEEAEEEEPEEDETEEEDREESEDSDDEYEEILSGTVGDAKDAIDEMDSPDYERLLELEKEGKDRKTLKGYLEGKL